MNKENRELTAAFDKLRNYGSEIELDYGLVTMDKEQDNFLEPDKIINIGEIHADYFGIVTNKHEPLAVSIKFYPKGEVININYIYDNNGDNCIISRALPISAEHENNIKALYDILIEKIEESYK